MMSLSFVCLSAFLFSFSESALGIIVAPPPPVVALLHPPPIASSSNQSSFYSNNNDNNENLTAATATTTPHDDDDGILLDDDDDISLYPPTTTTSSSPPSNPNLISIKCDVRYGRRLDYQDCTDAWRAVPSGVQWRTRVLRYAERGREIRPAGALPWRVEREGEGEIIVCVFFLRHLWDE